MISSPSAAPASSSKSASSDLFDQSALSALAQRLVEAARRAGADAADAVAVRNISQGVEVRDGRVEESERSEGDDVGLRVLVGRRAPRRLARRCAPQPHRRRPRPHFSRPRPDAAPARSERIDQTGLMSRVSMKAEMRLMVKRSRTKSQGLNKN